jgi:hypothetical protein
MGSKYNNKVHFNDSTSLDVDSGGQILVAEGGVVSFPVLGTTAASATDVVSGTTLPNDGTVIFSQVNPSTAVWPRTFTVKAPVKGCHLDIIVCTTASTEATIDINLGTNVGVTYANTTSMQWIIASTDKSPSTYRAINLVGLSTSLWGVIGFTPSSTGWLFAATSS